MSSYTSKDNTVNHMHLHVKRNSWHHTVGLTVKTLDLATFPFLPRGPIDHDSRDRL